MSSEVELSRRDGILTVTLNRPEKRNAMTSTMLRALVDAFRSAATDADVRVVVVRGAGKSFCAGLDLAEMAQAKAASGTVGLTDIQDVFGAVESIPQPTIAAVQGEAIAGGCELSLHCDLRVAADDARFSMPLARLGLALPLPLVQRLVDAVGTAATKEIFFTGESVPAARALTLGMVNRVVPLAGLADAAEELARTIAANAPLALRYFKRAIDRTRSLDRTIERRDLDEELKRVAASEDIVEGVSAMREKRPPKFRGR